MKDKKNYTRTKDGHLTDGKYIYTQEGGVYKVPKCAYPSCLKEPKHDIPGGSLWACDDHIDLAKFIYAIHDETEFHDHAE